MSDPPPYRTRLEVRQQVIATLTQIYAEGLEPDGQLDLGGRPWTRPETVEAFMYTTELFIRFAWEADQAGREERSPDAADFLRRQALALAADPPLGPF